MARENGNYRDHIELINAHFGGKAVLSMEDVYSYTGRQRKWCQKHLGLSGDGITVLSLAKALAKFDSKGGA